MVDIAVCKPADVDELLSFIDNHWKKDHIFVHNRALFDFQHRSGSDYHFLLARDVDSGTIEGIFGYIPVGHYDHNLSGPGDHVWGAIWKVRDDSTVAGLGLVMLKKLVKQFAGYGAIGLSQDAVQMYQALRFSTGIMHHYFVLNPSVTAFHIAQIPPDLAPCRGEAACRIEPVCLQGMPAVEGCYTPRKSIEYLKNRYLHHPIYTYGFWGVYADHGLTCILVYRTIEVEGRSCIRIVDVLGDLSRAKGLGFAIAHAIRSRPEVEYVDLLNWGIDPAVFTGNGFLMLDQERTDLIVPNYFEPFEKRNVRLFCGHNSKASDYVFFKGDADQDRPNMI